VNTESLLEFIIGVAEDFKANDLVALQVSSICDFADYFVIMSGTSSTHVRSLTEEIHLKTKHAGRPPLSVEGAAAGEWALLDYGDVVVHVFLPDKRAFYDLESLWSDALRVYPNGKAEEPLEETGASGSDHSLS